VHRLQSTVSYKHSVSQLDTMLLTKHNEFFVAMYCSLLLLHAIHMKHNMCDDSTSIPEVRALDERPACAQ
jgi:hypothetical protein